MTKQEMRDLHSGDLVRSKGEGQIYMVISNQGTEVIVVRAGRITLSDKWDLVGKASYDPA